MYYEIYVGDKPVRVCMGLVETYKFLKLLHYDILYHQLLPFMRIRDLKSSEAGIPFVISYILFEIQDKLYIRQVKVVKRCLASMG